MLCQSQRFVVFIPVLRPEKARPLTERQNVWFPPASPFTKANKIDTHEKQSTLCSFHNTAEDAECFLLGALKPPGQRSRLREISGAQGME